VSSLAQVTHAIRRAGAMEAREAWLPTAVHAWTVRSRDGVRTVNARQFPLAVQMAAPQAVGNRLARPALAVHSAPMQRLRSHCRSDAGKTDAILPQDHVDDDGPACPRLVERT